MKKNYIKLFIVVSLLMTCLMGYSQGIHLSLANVQNTNDGTNDFYEADVMIQTIDSPGSSFKLGSGQFYFNYNTAAFGINVFANSRIEITYPAGEYICGQVKDVGDPIPIYETFTIADNTNSRISFAFSQNLASSTFVNDNVTNTPGKLCHIKIQYSDFNEAALVDLFGDSGFDNQFYTACGPDTSDGGSTFASADCTGFPNTQLFNDSFGTLTEWTGATNSDWDTASNWTAGIPTTDVTALIPATSNRPTASGAVTVNSVTIHPGASVIAQSSFSGSVTYNLDITDTNWHLVSSPVEGEQYNAEWITSNLIDDTTSAGTNVGIGTYSNTPDADGEWVYVPDGGTGNINNGQGYAILRDATGTVLSFTGTLNTGNHLNTINIANGGTGNENRWNLVGNPYSSYLRVSDLITANSANLTVTHQTVYVWNGTSYIALTGTDYIHPGQGFFVNADNSNANNFSISESLQSHQSGVPFYRSSSDPSITLMMTDGNEARSTEINYLTDKTTGLDPSFDVGTFTGQSTAFNMYSHLVANSEGVDFMRQALPQDYENLIVPIGINANAGTNLSFTASVQNLPDGLKLFLEDTQNNTYNRLDLDGSDYSITLDNDMNGIGRFYLRTTSQTLSIDDVNLDNISMYTTADNRILNIDGLNDGKASLQLFDLTGKRILDSSFQSNRVNTVPLPGLPAGVYIVRLQSENSRLNKRILID